MSVTLRVLPGFLTVKGASDRLRLAPRSVRDLIYSGRLPSVRLGRRHCLRWVDVEAERRRRLGLPLPGLGRPARPRRRAASPPPSALRTETWVVEHPVMDAAPRESRAAVARPRHLDSSTRRQRAAERARLFQNWLHSGHRPSEPRLPFTAVSVAAAATCGACGRAVRAGGRMLDAQPVDGRDATRLCPMCARRWMLAWADERRRDAAAARRLARELGTVLPAVSPPRTETA